MRVLTVNAGSSSLKLRLLSGNDAVVASADLPRQAEASIADPVSHFLAQAPGYDAVGHRVVHGGPELDRAVLVDDRVKAALVELVTLAPLHNAASIEAMELLARLRPGVAQVACFDTAFHAGMPAAAATYALPQSWNTRWGLRRYGFHGLSHAYSGRRAAELLGRPSSELRLVTAHLGSGASLAAVAGGRSVDTTMGFTPLEGLMMGTRAGSVDPGLLLYLLRHEDLSAEEVEEALETRSGLLGLSGVSADLRVVVSSADTGDAQAALAYAVYLHRLRAGIASMAAAMGGLDGIVFTGGVGENSARLRRDACAGLGFLGLVVEDAANEHASGDRCVSPAGASVPVLVVAAREDLEIARQVRQVLSTAVPPRPIADPGETR